MSLRRKIKNKAQVVKGWARQRLGLATGNKRLQAGGKTSQAMGHLKQGGEKAKDALKR
ncbi:MULTISPECIES: CsbD family protein [unclassified Nonomuraea]|uniref:CsbD family protein n=1 Tax=unclassified Nonomuraea TaxID=2593643 RepID=UPI0035C1E030